MQTKFRFNKKTLDQIPAPESRTRLYDSGLEGLIVELSPSGSKTFRVYKKIKGQAGPTTITLGKYPAMSIEVARKSAMESLTLLSQGINPNEEARQKRLSDKTLDEVYQDYLRFKPLRDSTRLGYRRCMETYLAAYRNKSLSAITEDIVKKEHRRITEFSPAQADLVMRFLRALFNFAKYEYRGTGNSFLFEHNPVSILSHQRLWNKVARKNTRLTRGQLPDWFDGLETVRQSGSEFAVSVCDMTEMALLTGLRRGELMALTWDRVNLDEATYYIDTTKNGHPLELPISSHLFEILKRRHKSRGLSLYVFSAPSESGKIVEPRKVLAEIELQSGVKFTLHDLRRTFTTNAELLGLGSYTIKRLLNHRTRRDDVTAGYMVLTPEELREPAQRIEDALLTQAGVKFEQSGIDEKLVEMLANCSDREKRELLFSLAASQKGVRNV
jgi:integrase